MFGEVTAAAELKKHIQSIFVMFIAIVGENIGMITVAKVLIDHDFPKKLLFFVFHSLFMNKFDGNDFLFFRMIAFVNSAKGAFAL